MKLFVGFQITTLQLHNMHDTNRVSEVDKVIDEQKNPQGQVRNGVINASMIKQQSVILPSLLCSNLIITLRRN